MYTIVTIIELAIDVNAIEPFIVRMPLFRDRCSNRQNRQHAHQIMVIVVDNDIYVHFTDARPTFPERKITKDKVQRTVKTVEEGGT